MDGPFGVPNFVGPEGKGGVLPSPPVPPSKWWEGAAAHLFTFDMYLHVKRKKRGEKMENLGGSLVKKAQTYHRCSAFSLFKILPRLLWEARTK